MMRFCKHESYVCTSELFSELEMQLPRELIHPKRAASSNSLLQNQVTLAAQEQELYRARNRLPTFR